MHSGDELKGTVCVHVCGTAVIDPYSNTFMGDLLSGHTPPPSHHPITPGKCILLKWPSLRQFNYDNFIYNEASGLGNNGLAGPQCTSLDFSFAGICSILQPT